MTRHAHIDEGSKRLRQIRRGLLTYVILLIIKNANPSVSIFDILGLLSSTEFATSESTIYPLISKIRKDGLIISGWEDSDEILGRKYFYLTAKGERALQEFDRYWKIMNRTLQRFRLNFRLKPESRAE